jgi:hypothetical protein
MGGERAVTAIDRRRQTGLLSFAEAPIDSSSSKSSSSSSRSSSRKSGSYTSRSSCACTSSNVCSLSRYL